MGKVQDVRTDSVRSACGWREQLAAEYDEVRARLHYRLADDDDAEEWL